MHVSCHLRHLPPMKSDSQGIERSDVGLDEVSDPYYPTETIEQDGKIWTG